MHSAHPEETAAQVAWPGADSVGKKREILYIPKAVQGIHYHLHHPLKRSFPDASPPCEMERATLLFWLNGATLFHQSSLTHQNSFVIVECDSLPRQFLRPVGSLLQLENVLGQRKQRLEPPTNLVRQS